MKTTHAVGVRSQTWQNVPPYPEAMLWRAQCPCGWTGTWWHYKDNAVREGAAHARPEAQTSR
jgi:hypothetical protein